MKFSLYLDFHFSYYLLKRNNQNDIFNNPNFISFDEKFVLSKVKDQEVSKSIQKRESLYGPLMS